MKKIFISLFLIGLTTLITSCSAGISGLQSYVNPSSGYEFLYPNGWIQVDVKKASPGVDVVFRDLIERDENLSVIISDVPANKTLEDLGTPTDIGYSFFKAVNSSPELKREADFITAESRQVKDQTYYILEYEVKTPNQPSRHNIASVAVSRGKLFTFNLSASEKRWNQVKDTFEIAAKSFTIR